MTKPQAASRNDFGRCNGLRYSESGIARNVHSIILVAATKFFYFWDLFDDFVPQCTQYYFSYCNARIKALDVFEIRKPQCTQYYFSYCNRKWLEANGVKLDFGRNIHSIILVTVTVRTLSALPACVFLPASALHLPRLSWVCLAPYKYHRTGSPAQGGCGFPRPGRP